MRTIQWVIPCPSCSLLLRFSDMTLLGRRGQCPRCGEKFELDVPKADDFVRKRETSGVKPETARPEETVDIDISHLVD